MTARIHLSTLIILSVLALAIYQNSLDYPFVYDDIMNISDNENIRLHNLSLENLKQAAKGYKRTRPIANISFALNYYFCGYKTRYYRLVNVIIHIINGALIFHLAFLTIKITSFDTEAIVNKLSLSKLKPAKLQTAYLTSLITALIWLVHPVQIQSVTYIVQRMNSLAASFYLMALLFFIHGRIENGKQRKWTFYFFSLIAGVFALGSKENAATLPFMVFFYEWYFFRSLSKEWLTRNLKVLALPLLLFALAALLYLGTNPVRSLTGIYASRDFTLAERLLTQLRVLVFYISILVLPHPGRLNLDHHFIKSTSLFDPISTFPALVVLLTLVGAIFYLGKSGRRLASFCILWFLLNLSIESSVIPLELVYEHRLYLPSFGLVLIMTSACLAVFPGKLLVLPLLISGMIVSLFSYWTIDRNRVWKDKITLWRDCVRKSPDHARSWEGLANAYKEKGMTAKTIEAYVKALELKPEYPRVRVNLGIALQKQGRIKEAIEHFNRALKFEDIATEVHFNLGIAYTDLKDFEKAEFHYFEALRRRPGYAEVYNNLGILSMDIGDLDRARERYIKALELDPSYTDAFNNIGAVLTKQEKFEEALPYYHKALKLNPDYPEAHQNLAEALARLGRDDEAAFHYSKALELNPDNAGARVDVANKLFMEGDLNSAIEHYLAALKVDPEYALAHYNLGNALLRQGSLKEAAEHYSEALRIDPKNVGAHNNYGSVMGQLGRYDEAVKHFSDALRLNPDNDETRVNLNKARQLAEQHQQRIGESANRSD
jgi:protein O-mannosyl-transferase